MLFSSDLHVKCLRLGGNDFLTLPLDSEVLLAHIEARLQEQRGQVQKKKREILRFADIELDRQTHSVYCGSHMLTLTPTEYKLLALFLQNPSFVLERDHIMEQIWGVAAVELNTVDVHVGGLRKKLEAKGARLIHTIRGVGYVLKEATNKI